MGAVAGQASAAARWPSSAAAGTPSRWARRARMSATASVTLTERTPAALSRQSPQVARAASVSPRRTALPALPRGHGGPVRRARPGQGGPYQGEPGAVERASTWAIGRRARRRLGPLSGPVWTSVRSTVSEEGAGAARRLTRRPFSDGSCCNRSPVICQKRMSGASDCDILRGREPKVREAGPRPGGVTRARPARRAGGALPSVSEAARPPGPRGQGPDTRATMSTSPAVSSTR